MARKTGTLGLIAEAWTAALGVADNICRDVRRGSWRNLAKITSTHGAREGGKRRPQSQLSMSLSSAPVRLSVLSGPAPEEVEALTT